MPLSPLTNVLDRLLGPDGCPWDKRQTPQSLCDYILEEAFELVDAIRAGNPAEARGELGDLFFLLLFTARLYEEQGEFTLDEALGACAAKMIRRHPHVYAETEINSQEQLLANWERIKREEKKEAGASGEAAGAFSSLPKGLPPLLKAYRIHSKAARLGFTWETDQDAEAQAADEWREFQEAKASGHGARTEQEFGDYLFTLVEVGRRLGIKANAALGLTNIRFLDRFARMEQLAAAQGLDWNELDLNAKNALWDQVKKAE